MKRPARFLRRSVTSDPHLWIAFAALAIFVLWHFLKVLKWLPWEVPHDGLLIVITIGILTLVGDRLWEREEIGEQVKENAERLGTIARSVLDKRVVLCSRPSNVEEYAHLWGGFTETYCVYNPSYRVDKNVSEDEIVKMFIHRYQNPKFREARYLFLTSDDSGKDDLKMFRELMARVKQAYPKVIKKIRVKQIKNKAASSESEMYLGFRYGEQRGVMELKGPTLGSQHGMPNYYLVIDDKDVIEHYLKDHFEPAWSDKEAQDFDIFT